MFPLPCFGCEIEGLGADLPRYEWRGKLVVLVGEAGIVRKARCRECEDDRVLDVIVGGAVIFDFVVWVL